jgi:hypothetical protein
MKYVSFAWPLLETTLSIFHAIVCQKAIFEKELVKKKGRKLPSMPNNKLSKNDYLEKTLSVGQ